MFNAISCLLKRYISFITLYVITRSKPHISLFVLLDIYKFKKSILIKHEYCLSVCSRFPKPPEVPASLNFGSRCHLGEVGS